MIPHYLLQFQLQLSFFHRLLSQNIILLIMPQQRIPFPEITFWQSQYQFPFHYLRSREKKINQHLQSFNYFVEQRQQRYTFWDQLTIQLGFSILLPDLVIQCQLVITTLSPSKTINYITLRTTFYKVQEIMILSTSYSVLFVFPQQYHIIIISSYHHIASYNIILYQIMILLSKLLLFFTIILCCCCSMLLTHPSSHAFPEQQIQYWYANFGKIDYGQTMQFPLIFLNSNLCSMIGLHPLDKPAYILTSSLDQCSYTKKALIAQALGAKGVIIGRNKLSDQNKVVNSDDGNGKKVHITTLYIKMQTFAILKSLKNPQIRLYFEVVKKDITDVMIFLSASGRQNYIFLRNFRQYYQRLKKRINLDIFYHTIQCKTCDPSQCILDNKYCIIDEQHSGKGVGSLIIKEQIRQFNIFQRKGSEIWLNYLNYFDEECNEDWNSAEECSLSLLKRLQIVGDMNFGNIEDIMMEWRYKQTTGGFSSCPQISVNSVLFTGNLNAEDLYGMICQSLNSPGQQCSDAFKRNNGWHIVIGIFLLALLIFIILYRRCRKSVKKIQPQNKPSSQPQAYITILPNNAQNQDINPYKRMQRFNEEL